MKKKILFVANTDMHISLCYLPYMKYLKDKGYCVHVATNTDTTFEYCDKKIKLSITRSPFRLQNIKAVRSLEKILMNEKYDLVCSSTPMGSVVARLAYFGARKVHKSKMIYTAHGFHFFKGSPLINWLIYYPIEKKLMPLVDVLITINSEDYQFAKKHFKVDTKYIKGIGFNSAKFEKNLNKRECNEFKEKLGLKVDDYVITYVAELSKRKRQDYLITAIKELDLPNVKVLLPGNNLTRNKTYNTILKYHLEDKIKILGFRNDISELLDISDLVVSVSNQEGLPLNIMEAMKKEKPIIVTNCRGNRDLIRNGYNGIVVSINDRAEFINAIKKVYGDKEFAKKIGTANKKIVDQYSIEEILPQYAEIYDQLLEGHYEKGI